VDKGFDMNIPHDTRFSVPADRRDFTKAWLAAKRIAAAIRGLGVWAALSALLPAAEVPPVAGEGQQALTLAALADASAPVAEVGQWQVFETSYETRKTYARPFVDVEVNVVFSTGDKQWTVPAFWAGANRWTVRFAPPVQGQYTFHVQCSDQDNADLNGHEQPLRVVAYAGSNPVLKHGFLRISADQRHLEHADGTPFFWLGDTWWKGLCERLTWDGFQELTSDRQAKGFSVVQIVCGVYPDEGLFQPGWENEGGQPYLTRDFTVSNPAYFQAADRRIQHLVDAGLVPAIVGGWGRGDCNSMLVGIEGIQRHWRHLIARYGAYPTVWIIGGESGGPQWTEVARYVQQIDPCRHPATVHPFQSGRTAVTDETVIDFDMLQTGHGDWDAARGAIPQVRAAHARTPPLPVLIGECCYEGHMQTAFQDVQRFLFWSSMLSGSAGHTYGAAGVWHASVDGDPGIANVYDFTTWKEGMNYPGSTQLGLGKKLLEQYPWADFEPHPEWVEAGCFAAGIPGQVRFVYLPRRNVYNWSGLTVKQLERDVPYRAFYFNPTNGKRYALGTVVSAGPSARPVDGHTQPLLFADRFDESDASAWKDYGTPTQRQDGRLVGGKGLVTLVEKIDEKDLTISADANSDAEAGLILRFHDPLNYLVALYTPSLKQIYLHDRKDGQWGEPLGAVDVPEIGPKIHLAAAACGDYAALLLTDGTKTFWTPTVKVSNTSGGKAGLWLFQIGERQQWDNVELSRTPLVLPKLPDKAPSSSVGHEAPPTILPSDEYRTPKVPSPQDWVLVLERVSPPGP